MIEKTKYGVTSDGNEVSLYKLTNKNGIKVLLTDFGATIISILTPDKSGQLNDIVLGFDNLDGYLKNEPYFGGIVGRYANRIANATFTLNNKTYRLVKNNGNNSLHGGVKGFNKVLWICTNNTESSVEFFYLSNDGEEGYPGDLSVWVNYSLSDNNELTIEYKAMVNEDTILNLTNHTYFNLSGENNGSILKHKVVINADKFVPVDDSSIPTGKLASIIGTPMDFRIETEIGDRIYDDYDQLKIGLGYDNSWSLDNTGNLVMAARVIDQLSGRKLEVYTTEPGVQFYTGNNLGKTIGKKGVLYQRFGGFCLECQHFPDSPNHPNFPTTTLKSGQEYRQTTIYKFTT